MLSALNKHRFLFEELVKRDFDRKYKGSFLGAAWSVLNPLLSLLIMRFIFGHFFGSAIPHFTTYLFCGNIVFSFFSESSAEGLMALYGNAHIFTKVNVPKYLFLLSKNAQTLINFGITLCVFFLFCALDGIVFTWKFLVLVYPIIMLLLFNLGIRRNAYLRGAMLGYTREFMDEKHEEIIDFAELRAFEDRSFKQLSIGMQSRLAFSIASLVQPDILILDEVLSVGDGAFAEKSEAKMREILDSGATTILVSHSLDQVRELCNKVLWLHQGRQIDFGETEVICDRYQAFLHGEIEI